MKSVADRVGEEGRCPVQVRLCGLHCNEQEHHTHRTASEAVVAPIKSWPRIAEDCYGEVDPGRDTETKYRKSQ